MARNKKHKNDKFYTKPEVVRELINLVDLSKYDMVIEPSAGNGAFSKNITHQNLISLDILPEDSSISPGDWLIFEYTKTGKVLVIGNPPFGNQGSLALNFIKKCDSLQVDTIAFILPKSFKKQTLKNKIPPLYHLVNEIDLDDNSYTLLDKDYSVPSVFQIWERREGARQNLEMKRVSHLIRFVKKGDNPDYSLRRVGFYAGMIYDQIHEKSEQSHYFIQSSPQIKEFLRDYKWDHNNTSGPRSIGKAEIIRVVEAHFV